MYILKVIFACLKRLRSGHTKKNENRIKKRLLIVVFISTHAISLLAQTKENSPVEKMPDDVIQIIDSLKKEGIKTFMFFRKQEVGMQQPANSNSDITSNFGTTEIKENLFWKKGDKYFLRKKESWRSRDTTFNLYEPEITILSANNPMKFYLLNKKIIDLQELYYFTSVKDKQKKICSIPPLPDYLLTYYEFWFVTKNTIYKYYQHEHIYNKENTDIEINKKSKLNQLRKRIERQHES
ncbi:hypothetical protein [Flavobacterium chilense]|uniref:Uncharacterized protein n=1 Tax=Flavobacterium chilense TaxID=946677 RepID=A0A1M7F4W4_9FLAO|nr:hypothetical protein [Flavobacterium chilense]SHL99102.1 hypothetical protein SAMN05444484_103227 [Flavobacterium chilense]